MKLIWNSGTIVKALAVAVPLIGGVVGIVLNIPNLKRLIYDDRIHSLKLTVSGVNLRSGTLLVDGILRNTGSFPEAVTIIRLVFGATATGTYPCTPYTPPNNGPIINETKTIEPGVTLPIKLQLTRTAFFGWCERGIFGPSEEAEVAILTRTLIGDGKFLCKYYRVATFLFSDKMKPEDRSKIVAGKHDQGEVSLDSDYGGIVRDCG